MIDAGFEVRLDHKIDGFADYLLFFGGNQQEFLHRFFIFVILSHKIKIVLSELLWLLFVSFVNQFDNPPYENSKLPNLCRLLRRL